MTDTIRKDIIDELVTVFNAYTFSAVTDPTIYRGRQVFDPDTEAPPLVTILPRPETNLNENYARHDLVMPVDIICLARLGASNPSDLGEAILGDLIRCTFGYESGGEKVGGLTGTYADYAVYKSGGIDVYPDVLGQEILHVGITIEIHYTTNAGNPYSNT